jgi:3-isopropylmalate/(R)-2-methylmalate dehydratase large subunit
MITEMAGIIGFVPEFKDAFLREVEEFSGTNFDPVLPDEDCTYADIFEIDADGLSPQVAAPHAPTNVFDVSDLKGTSIDSGFIGSCTNGRTEDFLEAYRVLKGKRVKERIMLKVVPATKRVYKELLENGVLGGLFESGAIIDSPGCGGCAEGMVGLTGKGEVQISTGNRNFAGKQGKGETYLASPAVVAASCLLGQITFPEDV